jgi:hypothetical protein
MRSQQIKQWSVGTGTIRWETLALEEQEALGCGVSLHLGHQAGFANACLATEQHDT